MRRFSHKPKMLRWKELLKQRLMMLSVYPVMLEKTKIVRCFSGYLSGMICTENKVVIRSRRREKR